ncbi:MAG TPA: SDR family NAD(P)-dependent oxidoreductase [Thermoanaerobaculia bacterium]|jgi:CDP-paratose 2-epimerase|nr:SDR family NAD(P)-dependent oxidoreductase [Thermoanaerobaculia bacterium]
MKRPAYVLITGGCGFIGTNVAERLLRDGRRVLLYDNLSRAGVEQNLAELQSAFGERLDVETGDVRQARALTRAVRGAEQVFHFAAQVAVTTSLVDPRTDFEVNARGTLNVLEAIRGCTAPPPLLFTSTNKVYGALDDVAMTRAGRRYVPEDARIAAAGISERRPLDFHSPYGCSKGTADQYVLDFARSYRIPAVVFRMSCIYGLHQFGNEDQGWVAHFLLRALAGEPITLYGDGLQVRDVLFAEDLVEAMLLAQQHMERTAGQAFNMGGGPGRTISLLELLDLIERIHGERPDVTFEEWRTGDQRYYVSDTERFRSLTGWSPRVPVREGVERLYRWLAARQTAKRPAAAAARAPIHPRSEPQPEIALR